VPHFFSIATGRLITVQARVVRKTNFPTAHAVKIKGRSEEALYPREFSDSLVFTSDKGEAIHYQRWRESRFDKTAVAVGLDGVQPHDLRRILTTHYECVWTVRRIQNWSRFVVDMSPRSVIAC